VASGSTSSKIIACVEVGEKTCTAHVPRRSSCVRETVPCGIPCRAEYLVELEDLVRLRLFVPHADARVVVGGDVAHNLEPIEALACAHLTQRSPSMRSIDADNAVRATDSNDSVGSVDSVSGRAFTGQWCATAAAGG
jgi:hypothetical protein